MAGVLAAVSLAVTVRLGAPHYTRGGLDAYVLDVGQGDFFLLGSIDKALQIIGRVQGNRLELDVAVDRHGTGTPLQRLAVNHGLEIKCFGDIVFRCHAVKET